MRIFPVDIGSTMVDWDSNAMSPFLANLPPDHQYVIQYKEPTGGVWCMMAIMFTLVEAKKSVLESRQEDSEPTVYNKGSKYQYRIARVQTRYLPSDTKAPLVAEIIRF